MLAALVLGDIRLYLRGARRRVRLRDPNRTVCVSLIRLHTADGAVDLAKGTSNAQTCANTRAARRGRRVFPSQTETRAFSVPHYRGHTFPSGNTSISGIPRGRASSPTLVASSTIVRARVVCVPAHPRPRVRVSLVCVAYARAHPRIHAYVQNARNNFSVSVILIDSFA